jgi:hypothetical protein
MKDSLTAVNSRNGIPVGNTLISISLPIAICSPDLEDTSGLIGMVPGPISSRDGTACRARSAGAAD